MDIFTWPMAATAVGGITSICLTILKLAGGKKSNGNSVTNKDLEELKNRSSELKQQLAVLNAQFNDSKEDNKDEHAQLRSQIKDITDLLHDLLTKLAAD